jgi:hypothetical protein
MFFAACFAGLSALSAIAELNWYGTSEISVINFFIDPSSILQVNSTLASVPVIGSVLSFLSIPANFLTMLWKMLVFDYSYLTGDLIYLRIFFCCFSFGMVWGIISWLRGTSS